MVCLLIAIIFGSSCKNNKNGTWKAPLQDFCETIHDQDTISLSESLIGPDTLKSSGSDIYVLEEGDGSMIARAWLTGHAEKTIDIQYFIFSVDNVGLIACDFIVRAADRGVKIRILVDDIMVDADAEDLLIMDAHPNIDIKIYNPGTNIGKNIWQKTSKLITDFRGVNQRMHNKTFIVDHKIVITGGRNIADEYFDYDHEYNFRDRDVLLMGKICNEVQHSFNMFWENALSVPVDSLIKEKKPAIYDHKIYDNLHQYACNPDNFWPQVRQRITQWPKAFKAMEQSGAIVRVDSVYFVSDDPGKNKETKSLSGGGKSTDALIKLIKNAKYTIDIQSPYLVTTPLSRNLFKTAINRGVKLRILTNSLASTDNLEAFSGYQRDRKKLLATGADIYEFRPDAACRYHVMTGALQKKMNYTPTFGLHSKTMVIDGQITVIGTFNLDPRSANLNTECITVIHSKDISRLVMKGIEEEFLPENAWRTTVGWNPDEKVDIKKRAKTMMRKVIPKSIL
ncbi:MAG: phospholipase D family protein [Saprospiraceae bacterium]|nr:phospholipase D family protein [Saprospiraceae bacterium]